MYYIVNIGYKNNWVFPCKDKQTVKKMLNALNCVPQGKYFIRNVMIHENGVERYLNYKVYVIKAFNEEEILLKIQGEHLK